MDANDLLGELYDQTGAKPVKFPELGDTCEGRFIALRSVQLPEYRSKRLETWDDGSPKYTPIVTLQTDEMEGPGDDGRRDVYCRSGLYTALRNGLRAAFPKGRPTMEMLQGCTLTFTFTETIETEGDDSDRKVFTCEVVRPKGSK